MKWLIFSVLLLSACGGPGLPKITLDATTPTEPTVPPTTPRTTTTTTFFATTTTLPPTTTTTLPPTCHIEIQWQRPTRRWNGSIITPQEIANYYVKWGYGAVPTKTKTVVANVNGRHITQAGFNFHQFGVYSFQITALDIYGTTGVLTPVFQEDCSVDGALVIEKLRGAL